MEWLVDAYCMKHVNDEECMMHMKHVHDEECMMHMLNAPCSILNAQFSMLKAPCSMLNASLMLSMLHAQCSMQEQQEEQVMQPF